MSQERPSRPVRASVAEKRRASERLKEEPVVKRRDSGTPRSTRLERTKPKAIPIPTPETSTEEEKVVVLPSKVAEGQLLPTLKEPQPKDLSGSEYKSVAESGVIAASVARSRQKWTQEGLFEKYWSRARYTKKGDMTEEERKAEAERKAQAKGQRTKMALVGTCKLIVEPHIFDVSLYTVKDPAPQPNTSTSQQFVPYGPANASPNSPAQNYTASPYHPSPLQQAQTAPTYQDPRSSTQTSQHSPPSQPPPNLAPSTTTKTSNTKPKNPPQAPKSQSQNSSASQSQSQSQQQRPDPVIHMLAQRAATDHELKQIMTIVATGKADPKQLEFFQRHIDELTKIVRANEEAERKKNEVKTAPTVVAPKNGNHASPVQSRPSTPAQSQTVANSQPPPVPTPVPVQRAPHPNQYTYQHTVPKPAKPPPNPLHVLLEFSGNQSDRFLFPRYTILEYLPGFKSCVCSFLVVRKLKPSPPSPTSSESPAAGKSKKGGAKKAEDEKEIYQPVTVKFSACDTGTLAVLAKVVAPQEEVRAWMEDVMARAERAREGFLAGRLPRRRVGVEGVSDD